MSLTCRERDIIQPRVTHLRLGRDRVVVRLDLQLPV